MPEIKECIIIGGGSSIKQADFCVLKPLLASKFTILTNYSFKHFEGTFMCFTDRDFYKTTSNKNPDIYEELKQLPLIIGVYHKEIEQYKLPNTIFLPKGEYNHTPLQKGFYTSYLTGFFAISVAEFLMNYSGVIYLLGYDWTKRKKDSICPTTYTPYNQKIDTHYYSDKEIPHRGQHWLDFYEHHDADGYFKPFIKPGLKIYNVSLESNINCFEKISYTQFFGLVSIQTYIQEELRTQIRSQLCLK